MAQRRQRRHGRDGRGGTVGEARSSRIHYATTDGPNHTDFGFDPAHEKPYWVEVPDGAGGRRTERFTTMEGYHDFIENTVGAPSQGDIPEHLSGRNPTAADAEPVALATRHTPVSEAEVRQKLEAARKAENVEKQLFEVRTEAEISEMKQLMEEWDQATYSSVGESIIDHRRRHGFGDDYLRYLRKRAILTREAHRNGFYLMEQIAGINRMENLLLRGTEKSFPMDKINSTTLSLIC